MSRNRTSLFIGLEIRASDQRAIQLSIRQFHQSPEFAGKHFFVFRFPCRSPLKGDGPDGIFRYTWVKVTKVAVLFSRAPFTFGCKAR